MGKRIFHIALALCWLTYQAPAQDPYFTQNLYHALYLSPAYTGYGSKLEVTLSYRNQWRNGDQPSYRTTYAAADAKAFCFSNNSYVALGGYALLDQEYGGLIRNTAANFSVATGLRLSSSSRFESRLMLGLQAGLVHRAYDLSDPLLFESVVLTGNNFDPLFGSSAPGIARRLVEDIGVGMALELKFRRQHALLLGASGQHLTSPALFGDERLQRKFGGNVLAALSFPQRLSLRIYSDVAIQGKALRSHSGALFGLVQNVENSSASDDYSILAGLTVSAVGDEGKAVAFESISPVVQFNYRMLGIIVTKDFNLSTSKVAGQRGGMEFILRFRIGQHKIRTQERLPRLCSEPCPLP